MPRFVLCLVLLALWSQIAHSASLGVSGGGNNPYGFLALEGDRDFGRFDVNTGLGISDGGPIAGIGTRFYFHESSCWFGAICRDRDFVGLHLSQSAGAILTITDDGQDDSTRYRIPPLTFVNINVGTKSIYWEKVAVMLRLGYHAVIAKREATWLSGPLTIRTEDEVHDATRSGFSFAAAAMVQF